MKIAVLEKEFARLMRQKPYAVEGGGWCGTFALEEDFIAFWGHFPEYPLVPAFVQIWMAQYVLESALKRQLHPSTIGTAKFMGQIKPGGLLSVHCLPGKTTSIGSAWDCKIYYAKEADEDPSVTELVAKFRLSFS